MLTSLGKGCKKFRGSCSVNTNAGKPWGPMPEVWNWGARQEDCCKFKDSLSHRVRAYIRKQDGNKNVIGVRK